MAVQSTTRPLIRMQPTSAARLGTVLALLAGTLLRLALAWRDLPTLDTLFFPDDTYISLGIARNIALGYGSTLGRQVLTNGYQPLYVWLMVPVYWLIPDDKVLPIHVALTLLALCGAATGWLIAVIVRRLSTPWHAMLACAIWMFDPGVLRQNLNGLETGLALLGIATTTWWYLARIRANDTPTMQDWAIWGVLAGLTILARVDQGILLGAMNFDLLLTRRSWATIRQLAVAGLCALLVITPWIVFSWSIGRGPLPESGAAVRYHALTEIAYTPNYASVFAHRLLKPLLTTPYTTLAAIGTLLVVASLRRARPLLAWLRLGMARTRPLRFALWYAGAMLLAYSMFIPAHWFFERYLHPLALFTLVAVIACLPVPRTLPGRWQRPTQITVELIVMLELALGTLLLLAQPPQDGYLPIGLWAEEHLAGQIIGSYQAGALSYWVGDRTTIVNLDGIVDRGTFRARKAGQLDAEIRRRGITWVLDWKPQPGYPPDGDFRILAFQQEIPTIRSLGAPWYLFKVNP